MALLAGTAWGQERPGCIEPSPGVSSRVASTIGRIGCGSVNVAVPDFAARYASGKCVASPADRKLSCEGPLRVDDLRDVRIEGAGWRIEFAEPVAGRGGIFFERARNVVVRNLVIAWVERTPDESPLPVEKRIHSRGRVAACDAGGELQLDGDGDGVAPVGALSIWDDRLGWPWATPAGGRATERYFDGGRTFSFSGGRSPCTKELAAFAGARVLVRHHLYTTHAFMCRDCERIALEGVTVRSAPGMGFVFWGGGSGFLLRRNTIAPQCAPNCSRAEPSVAADGAHFAAVGGGILIEENDFGWQGDDSVNVHGMLARGTVETETGPHGAWLRLDEKTGNRIRFFQKDEMALLFDRGLQERGSARILAVDATRNRIQLSASLPTGSEVVLTQANRVPRDVVVRNNRFHDHRARGILMAASDAVIENNVIERVTMAAIMIPADTDRWFEGPGAQRVVIRGNRISHVNARPYSASYPSAISAAFQPPPGYAGAIGVPIRDLLIGDNHFSNLLGNADRPVSLGVGVGNQQE